jgi:site-specific DNA-adenine methylase
MDKLIAFGWYGGKYSHLDWLLPLLPQTKHYCEPFGGSAAVLINREPSLIETYNDMEQLYEDWVCIEAPIKNCHSVKAPRQEVLWVNYEQEKEKQCYPHQISLF